MPSQNCKSDDQKDQTPEVYSDNDIWTSSFSKADFIEDDTDLPNKCRLINRDDEAAWVTCAVKGALQQTESSRMEGREMSGGCR